MSSRDDILSAVRRHLPEASPLPELAGPWIEYPDPIAQFASVLEMIGGRCVRVPNIETINRELNAMPVYAAAKQTVSRVAGAGASTMDGPPPTDRAGNARGKQARSRDCIVAELVEALDRRSRQRNALRAQNERLPALDRPEHDR